MSADILHVPELNIRGNDVMGAIEDVCEESIQSTKFFHGGPSRSEFGYVSYCPLHRTDGSGRNAGLSRSYNRVSSGPIVLIVWIGQMLLNLLLQSERLGINFTPWA